MTTHHGSCHCGAVAFSVEADITKGLACDCSYCVRKGTLLAFVPRTQFTLEKGGDNLTEYRFNKKVIAHLFCKTCGVQGFSYGTDPNGNEMAAINVRCLDGIDIETLPVTLWHGKDSQ